MIYLIFDCHAGNRDIHLNDEFEDHDWVRPEQMEDFNLNDATRRTLVDKWPLWFRRCEHDR